MIFLMNSTISLGGAFRIQMELFLFVITGNNKMVRLINHGISYQGSEVILTPVVKVVFIIKLSEKNKMAEMHGNRTHPGRF